MSDAERRKAERSVGWARLWARAKQIVTTDATGSDEDDHVIDEEAATVLAAHAGRLKGGLAKVAQLAAYDPSATFGGRTNAPSASARAILGGLWDHAPAISAGAIARVIEDDLGSAPQALFAHWDPAPLASASLGQVHAARLRDGTEVVVKVQYPGVADALRADLDDTAFVRKLAGAQIGRSLDESSLAALVGAVRAELDYRTEAESQRRFALAWQDDPVLRFPRVIDELSTGRVLTMTRARGKSVVEIAASGTPDIRRQAAGAIYKFAWGSPLAHGLLNADPNPGNFLIDDRGTPVGSAAEGRRGSIDALPDGAIHVWCLDFGCALELPTEVRDADRELWWALVDDDNASAAERFRMGLARSGLLRRADSLATTAHREWEHTLAAPLATHGAFHWSASYARDLADTTGRVLAGGGLALPAKLLLLWRQRLGAASVIAMLDATTSFRRVLVELIGNGRKALR